MNKSPHDSGSEERAALNGLYNDGWNDGWRATDGPPDLVDRAAAVSKARAALATPSQATECAPTLTECPRCKNDITKCDGLFAAPSQAVASALQAPEGWKLVPIEPTEEMHVAAVRTAIRCSGNADFPPRVYRAMLAAAPAHPVVQPGPGGSAPAPVPAGDAWALPDAIRVPLHKLWADIGYLIGRAKHGDTDLAVHTVKALCDEVERTVLAALSNQVPAGDAAMVALRRALDAAQVPSGYRADIIGFFCNEWNAALSREGRAEHKARYAKTAGQADQGGEMK
jgi:hypothetical protein